MKICRHPRLRNGFLAADAGQRSTSRAADFYQRVLKPYTGQGLTEFLGELSKRLAGYEDPNEWFRENFSGVLVERQAYGDTEGKIRYRIWENLCGLEEGRKSLVLQILTAPQEDMYLISVPSQLLIGSMNRYEEYLKKDGQERERIRETAEAYAEKNGDFLRCVLPVDEQCGGAAEQFCERSVRHQTGISESAAAAAGIQEKGTTRIRL